jgi:hypothetical protein
VQNVSLWTTACLLSSRGIHRAHRSKFGGCSTLTLVGLRGMPTVRREASAANRILDKIPLKNGATQNARYFE